MVEKTCSTCQCNKVCDHNKYGFENCGNYISADVVPKSEVDKIIAGWAYIHADVLNKLENAKAEVAREIFEEVEESLYNRDSHNSDLAMGYAWAVADMRITLAKLKKKYTEDGK